MNFELKFETISPPTGGLKTKNMNKKPYQQPVLRAVKIQQTHIICASDVKSLGTNLTGSDAVTYGGSGSGPARARSNSIWDDEE